MHRVRMLIHFGVIPYIVFDGDYLPSKAVTEVDRAKRREESKQKGLELYRLNKPPQAHHELQKAVDVTPEMAKQLINELKKIGVQYVVAPYEADAQLVYLERKGLIQGMLSEDSDLLVFGAKKLLTKLDQYGDCIEINRTDFTACRDVSLVGWTDAEFRRMAILSGCDYLASINKMGLKTAYRYLRKYKTIEKVLQMLAFDGQYHIPTGYLEKFYKAELTFLHQRVFCPEKEDIVMLTDLASNTQPGDLSFIGGEIQRDVAIGVAKGDLDPMTKQPLFIKSAAKTGPNTPWGGSRSNVAVLCSETKASRSIDSFFKPKRTPLAELDPNSFTPSPAQERLLRQANGASWSSSPAPYRAPALRSNTLTSTVPRPTPSADISQTLNAMGVTLPLSTPSKRRRLCSDPTVGPDLGNGRSPFFGTYTVDPSPSARTTKKNRKTKTANIAVWSDDSVEEAMAELPDISENRITMKKGKLEVFKDEGQEKSTETVSQGTQETDRQDPNSQCSIASRGTDISEQSTNTQATSVANSTTYVAQTLDKHVTAELKALTAKYAYQPGTNDIHPGRVEIQSRVESQDPIIRTQIEPKPQLHRQRSMTPLQRLGAGALNRSKSYSTTFKVGHGEPNKVSRQDHCQSISKFTERRPSLPVARSFGPDASMLKGSEDAIVPDFEESADVISSGSEGKERKGR